MRTKWRTFRSALATPIAEGRWKKVRDRIARWLLVLAGALAVQTALVHNPDYVINALYHGRQWHALQFARLDEAARAKLLERLCMATSMLEAGTTDPYRIPDIERCGRK